MHPLSIIRHVVLGSAAGRSLRFVLNKPSWPESIPKPVNPPNLGANYDTSWARLPLARIVRKVAIETITRPTIRTVATPSTVSLDRLEDLASPVIFAGNHSSHLDTSVVLTCLPARFRHKSVVAAGADYFFDKRWKGFLWALWVNIIPMEREKVSRRSADLAAGLIDEGWNLVIFPEGTRSRDGFAGPFRGGAAYLSMRCDVPVVPVHIEGTGKILGALSRTVRPGRTRITFGEPMRATEGENARDFNARIEHAVAVAADEGRTDWWSAKRRAALGETPSLQAPDGLTGWRKAWVGQARSVDKRETQWPLK